MEQTLVIKIRQNGAEDKDQGEELAFELSPLSNTRSWGYIHPEGDRWGKASVKVKE